MEHGPDKCRVREHFEILRKKTRVVCRITGQNVPSRGNWMGRELGMGGGFREPRNANKSPRASTKGNRGSWGASYVQGHYVGLHGLPDNFDNDFCEMLASV